MVEEIKELKKLTLKQENFCRYYATDRNFFGNGAGAYREAFKQDHLTEKSIRQSAWKLLQKNYIVARITELLDLQGFNDFHVDKQLLFLLTQLTDFPSKLGAIKEYNKLKSRITDKIDGTLTGKLQLDDKQFNQLIKLVGTGAKESDSNQSGTE